MPFHKRISNKYQFQISTNFKSLIGNWKFDIRERIFDKSKSGNLKFRKGFTLIEIVLSLFLIAAILSMLFAVSGTYLHSRRSNLQQTATQIASKQIEDLRNLDFTQLDSQNGSFTDPDLPKLPSGQGLRTITNYDADGKIKQVTITVTWIDNGISKNIKMETLISQYGL